MFKKRRSMLGRRHLVAQQTKQSVGLPKSDPMQSTNNSGDRRAAPSSSGGNSWRGRSGKKRTPLQVEKGSKDFKKCLFSKSPAYNLGGYRMHSNHAGSDLSSNEEFLDETGIANIAPTPRTTPRHAITPATLHQRRVQLESHRYGTLANAATMVAISQGNLIKEARPKATASYVQSYQSSYVCDFDDLKPPDLPGPSRLERILQEEESTQFSTASGVDFDNSEPPKLPDCTRLDRIIMNETLNPPLDIELGKMKSLNIADPIQPVPFSPPLSSTCIGSPDSEKKTSPSQLQKSTGLASETMKCKGSKLSTIEEDCDLSVIEFELNERTITDLDPTLMESTMNNTVRLNHFENIPEEKVVEESESGWQKILSCLNNMEQGMMNRAVALQKMQNDFQRMQNDFHKMKNDYQQDISSIRTLKKTLESFKPSTTVKNSLEDKENSFDFKVPTCKKQLDAGSKWFERVKKENPRLLKTPNASRNSKPSSCWTPRSLSKAVCNQMSELYDS